MTKLAVRRGSKLDINPCQAGYVQIVDSVRPAGHGFFYTSNACSGCNPGDVFIKKNYDKDGSLKNVPKEVYGCHKLQKTVLYIEEKIQKNNVIMASNPVPEE